ncbi:penicillin-binding protein 2 [Candidatus Poribacteria bacterium]|nr:penicillin-binding protein 2 [Candidatus Poribacteria bacterium]
MENYSAFRKQANLKNRLIIFTLVIQFFFIMILARIWYLQIIKFNHFQKLSLENRTRLVAESAPRGLFFDHNGNLLVNNRPACSIAVIPEDIKNNKKIVSQLCTLLDMTPGEIRNKIKKNKKELKFYPVRLKYDVSQEIITRIEENKEEYPGVMIIVESRRDYTSGELGAHFFGYLGKINDDELKNKEYKDYRNDDYIGKTGLERTYEKYLRGISGVRRIEVNALGQQLSSNIILDPIPGYNVILTIDKDLQELAEKLMENKKGSIVAIDPANGEILAMVSKPCFDPNMFSGQISSSDWDKLNNDPEHPLLNRAVMGCYPPGSTFKIVMALAALEEGVITQEYSENCSGVFTYGNMTYKCWKNGGHGSVNITEALVHSCNIFFYKLGFKVGINNIEKYAHKLGLGEITGIDLTQEKQGLVPNPAWKKKALKEPWFTGDNISVSVGQGYVLVTPLQMVNLIAGITNGENIYKPHFIKKVVSANNKLIYEFPKVRIKTLDISAKTLEIVKDALWKVVNRWGTGRRARIPGVNIIGKTGTAQIVAKADIYDNLKTDDIPEHIRPHAWFVSCGPSSEPKIAIAILIENGGEGGQVGAPIAHDLYDLYLKKERRDYSLDKNYHSDDIPREQKISITLKPEPISIFNSTDINQMFKSIILEADRHN